MVRSKPDDRAASLAVVRAALRDATGDDLRALFEDVADRLAEYESTVPVSTVVSPAFVARNGIHAGVGKFRLGGDTPAFEPGDGGFPLSFRASPDDGYRTLRNRVLQSTIVVERGFVVGP